MNVPLVLFWFSMAVSVFAFGALTICAIKPRSRNRKLSKG
jgi:hypothetical protein